MKQCTHAFKLNEQFYKIFSHWPYQNETLIITGTKYDFGPYKYKKLFVLIPLKNFFSF